MQFQLEYFLVSLDIYCVTFFTAYCSSYSLIAFPFSERSKNARNFKILHARKFPNIVCVAYL